MLVVRQTYYPIEGLWGWVVFEFSGESESRYPPPMMVASGPVEHRYSWQAKTAGEAWVRKFGGIALMVLALEKHDG